MLLRLAESGVNPLECKGNYSAISKNVKLAHDYPCYIWYSKDGTGRAGPQPAQAPYSLYQINVTAYPSTIEVVYNGALVCDFNVPIKGLKATSIQMTSYRRGRYQAVNFSRHAVSVCVSVCPSVTFVDCVKTNKHNNYLQICFTIGQTHILVFPYQTVWQYSVECSRGRQKFIF